MNSTDGDAQGNASTSIMTRLRQATKDTHQQLESLPYFKMLTDHRLPLECYVNQLSALAVIHGVLENEIASCDDERLSAVWEDGLRKLPLLEQDLAFFEPRVIPDAASPIEAALAMTQRIRLRRIENPNTLLGVLYVLEGSTLGNCMHRPDISATFHLRGPDGCRYYASYGEDVRSHWERFSEAMNTALSDPSLHEEVIEAAHEAFGGLDALYSALYPLDTAGKPFHVARINPEAGNHPIPEDEREIQAALRANERGWAEFGYYRQRFGERGKKFSASDTCWLATLVALDQESLQKQIDWLNTVLASRGMPSIMLEQTLRFLCEELAGAVPERAADYEKLRTAANALKSGRERFISEEDFLDLAAAFELAAGPELADRYRNTGRILVSAVADEKGGIEGVVAGVTGWLTDGDRFPDDWIRAVQEALRKARSAAS